ncbi:hypothetical protein OEZ85_006775 [Tetradesmus obliquus]|uniref:FAD-binding PCMH-type domain-containing protein n=1 Tax=Tetradesmus obliquus TaxID=3088 RepID=A0ABY8TVL2_TETOB|nr:hypothetical protein OEZ85_006775 [Tetradesmus obliquus]
MPLAFVQPASAADVSAAVRCSVEAGLRFVARNGGHNYEANSLVGGGVVIDLINLQELKIDSKANSMTVGAGYRLGSLYSKLTLLGYVLPGSTCVGVGISGLTLGGGIGHATRALGVLADSVLAATVVLANGTVVEADSKSHADLFWAIRGGGGLYGIVTSWKFKLFKAPKQVSVVRYRFRENCTEAKYAAVLGAFNAWQPWTLPKEVALAEVQCGYDSLQVQFWYWGPMSEANKTMASSPVFKLPNSYPFIHKEYSWADFVAQRMTNLHDEMDWGNGNLLLSDMLQRLYKERSSFVAASLVPLTPLNSSAVKIIAKFMVQAQKHAFIQSRAWGGQVTAVADDFNAFPWRQAPFECQVYSNSGDARKDRSWVDGLLAAVHPLIGKAEYLNYFHCVNDPWQAYFGPHAARLQAIKKAYDPQGRIGGLYCQQDNIIDE